MYGLKNDGCHPKYDEEGFFLVKLEVGMVIYNVIIRLNTVYACVQGVLCI